MKYIHLIKHHSAPLLAHVYEHIYTGALQQLFKNKGLYNYLDYYIHATTYDDAVITLEVALYTDKAMRLEPHLGKIGVVINDDSIGMAKAQIVAEKLLQPGRWDNVVLTKALRSLHTEPWLPLSGAACYDTYKTRRNLAAAEFFVAPKPHTKTLRTTLVLDEDERTQRRLLPLAHVVYTYLNVNIHELIAARYGYYTLGKQSFFKSGRAEQVATSRAWTQQVPNLTSELATCTAFIRHALAGNIIGELTSYLKSTISADNSRPDEVEVYNDTGIFVGGKGWREIGTEDNIRKVLQHTTLQLLYGREKQVVQLSELIESNWAPPISSNCPG